MQMVDYINFKMLYRSFTTYFLDYNGKRTPDTLRLLIPSNYSQVEFLTLVRHAYYGSQVLMFSVFYQQFVFHNNNTFSPLVSTFVATLLKLLNLIPEIILKYSMFL